MSNREALPHAARQLSVGEPFSPFRQFDGPVFPVSLFADPSLSPEAKIVLLRLFNYCGRKDHCNPGLPRLAADCALSEDRIGRALKELTAGRRIERKRNGPGRTASIRLLWHPSLFGSLKNSTGSTGDDSAGLRNQTDSLIPQNQGSDSAEPRSLDSATVRNAFKEEKDQFEKDQRKGSSSSKKRCEASEQLRAPTRPVDDDSQSLIPNAEAEAERSWTPYEIEFVRGTLARHRHAPYEPSAAELPDLPFITGEYLPTFRDFEDWRLYWASRGRQLPKPSKPGNGLYAADAKRHWPLLREPYQQQAQADPGEFIVRHQNLKGVSATVARLMASSNAKESASAPPEQAAPPQAKSPAAPEPVDRELVEIEKDLAFQHAQLAKEQPQALREWIVTRIGDLETKHRKLLAARATGWPAASPESDGGQPRAQGGEAPQPAATGGEAPRTVHVHRQPVATTRRRFGDHGFTRAGAILRGMAV